MTIEVFGLGTGRCGTFSLATLLQTQKCRPNLIKHERKPILPWQPDAGLLQTKLTHLRLIPQVGIRGDVALYYLPYVRSIATQWPDARFICLQRDEGETVQSYLRWLPKHDLWSQEGSKQAGGHGWNKCYPKFPGNDRVAALHAYWQHYYQEAATLQAELPQFRIFPTEALNTREGVESILGFIQLPRQYWTVLSQIHLHRSRNVLWAPTSSLGSVVGAAVPSR